jgi:hypothetical protein
MSGEKASSSILDKVLGYVDSPFKLFAIILMAVIAFVGYAIWQNQEFILGAYKEHKKLPTIAEERVEDAAAHLFKNTGAAVVAVFKVNPVFGTRVLYRAYTRDGRDKTHEGLDVGLFTGNASNNADVVALMAGEIPCGHYKTAQSEIGLWYIDQGMAYGCRISVPPEQGKFIGQITVGWKEEPTDLDAYRVLLRIAATMLSKSKQQL